ncbi:MAG: VTT domain-containing protein [Acidobacteriaceae bacterium]
MSENPQPARSQERPSRVLPSVFLAAKAATRPAHHRLIPAWVLHFGLAGLFIVAALDAAPIPLPIPASTDILILVLGAHGESPWLLAPVAVAGGLLGAWLTWKTGKKGGEAMLDRYLSKRLRATIKGRIRHHGTLTVFIASILPPPIPLTPFLLAAGALGVSRKQLLIAIGIGRSVRYGTEAALSLIYGRRILRWFNRYLAGWSSVILYTFLALLVAAIVFGIWKYRRDQRRPARPTREATAEAAS